MNTIAETEKTTSDVTITLIQKLLFLQNDSHYEFVSHSLSRSAITGIISKDVKAGTEITLELSFNNDIEFIQAFVESTENTNQDAKHKIYCKFIDPTPHQQKLLDKMIRTYSEKHLVSPFSKHIKKEYNISNTSETNWTSKIGLFSILVDIVVVGFFLHSLPVGEYFWETTMGQNINPDTWSTNMLLGTLYTSIFNLILLSFAQINNIINEKNRSGKWGLFLFINMLFSIVFIATSAYKLF